MAASILRCRFCQSSKVLWQNTIRNASNSYYVVLPEIPPDTPETSPLMRTHEYPQFSQINPDNTITGCAKLAIEYDVELGKHIEHLSDPKTDKNFESVFGPIEKISVPLNYAWRTAKTLNYVDSSEFNRKAFQRVHPQVERARNERWISEPLYNAVKEVAADRNNLNEYQSRLVDFYLLEARLNGIELSGPQKKNFLETLGNLIAAKNHFRNRVMLSHSMFSHNVDDFGQIAEMPKHLVAGMAVDKTNPSRGPWKVTLNQNVYQPFMEYCGHRLLRWNVWQAYNNRASIGQDSQNLSNHNIIKDIRNGRKDIAEILGYENFAQMSMETKMAGSVENVLNMIESLKTKLKPIADEEISTLQQFAQSEGFHDELEMWDIDYWRRRQKDHFYHYDQQEIAEYFPFTKVLDKMFALCKDLFGIVIKDCTSQADTWHEDVKFFKIFDEKDINQEVAAFYLDPYARPGKMSGGWMEAGRERSGALNTTPFSYMNLSLTPEYIGRPSLLTVSEVSSLFYELGSGLQQLLTTVPYSELSGQRNIEWDALHVCATLMSMIFFNPCIMTSISGHYETGKPLEPSQVEKILKVKSHLSAYDNMKQLYLSAYDMEMYISDIHWLQAVQNIWYEFMPVALHEDDNHPCSLTAIFSDHYPAAYYSFQWAEMIAADIIGAFEEVGFEDKEKVAVVGRRFRETFLAHGGGVPASEVFRRFRGRDPSQLALLKYSQK